MALCQILTFFFFIFYTFSIQIINGLHYRHIVIHCDSLQILLFTVTLNFVFKVKWKCVKFWAYLCKIFYVLHPKGNEIMKCSKRSYDCFLLQWRFVGVKWGIARATVDVTRLGLVLVIGVRGSE